MKQGFPLGEHFVELMFNLCIRFNTFKLGDAEKALFSALVLISPGILRGQFYTDPELDRKQVDLKFELMILIFLCPPSKKRGYIALLMSVGRSVGRSVHQVVSG
ncbi:hypothetical protein DPMN_023496 [Dreissena polymorpha]|uniref:Uncharacterized protein n=1 Tax=Dreissena polymorpha TaxID=45954 RepID=A0A9D4LKU4_DREPO|nr:hypothetical protein DPMN_023496 [Dreissena polymorpha]